MKGQRVYLPTTALRLREALTRGAFGPAPLAGQAVTSQLREALGSEEQEDLEYTAMGLAAQDSLALLGPGDPMVRLVAALDVASVEVVADADSPAAVSLPHEVPLRRLAAVHADSPDAAGTVTAARAALDAEGPEAEAVAACLDHELGWYAAQELADLLAQLRV